MKKIILTIGLLSIMFAGCASKNVNTGMSNADYNRANTASEKAFENLDKAFENLDKEFEKNVK